MTALTWERLAKRAFIGVSVVVIVLTAVSDEGDATVPAAQAKSLSTDNPASPQQRVPETVHVELERMARPAPQQEQEADIGNVFSATSWYMPPPPPLPPKPAPPPKPVAPPVPFVYLGFYEEAQEKIIMLVRGERLYTVSVGEVIEDVYRIESVSAGMVELTYLPLNIRQTIKTATAS